MRVGGLKLHYREYNSPIPEDADAEIQSCLEGMWGYSQGVRKLNDELVVATSQRPCHQYGALVL